MSRWKSNGGGYSPNEQKLVGERVVFMTKGRVRAIGILKDVRAATRGNWTLAVTWKQLRQDGKSVNRDLPIWMHRNEWGFSIERADDHQHDQDKWLTKRQVIT